MSASDWMVAQIMACPWLTGETPEERIQDAERKVGQDYAQALRESIHLS